jgi:hypothetical protein
VSIHGIDPMLVAASASLLAQSDRIAAATGHRGELGHARETALLETLRNLLPRRISVRRGAVLGKAGLVSQQLDLVLCDLDHFPEFPYDSDTSLLMPDSVYGVVSIRTYLRPSEVKSHFDQAIAFKAFMAEALGNWSGFYAVLGYRWDGSVDAFVKEYVTRSLESPKGGGLDLAAAIDGGPLCFSLQTFGEVGAPPPFLASRSHISGMTFDPCRVDAEQPFVDAYKLLLLVLDKTRLRRVVEIAAPPPGVMAKGAPSTNPSFLAMFAGKSADVEMDPGMSAEFQMFYANVGAESWLKGSASEARLVVAGPAGYLGPIGWGSNWLSENEYCRQIQDAVPPGSLVAFSFVVSAPADAKPGRYEFFARPAVESAGALTPESRANVVTIR